MKDGSISVIIPAYNAALFIDECLDSVLSQSVRPAEIIVVDDGSTDETRSVISKYGEPIRLLSKENGGPASARNLGLQQAHGRYVAFLDADDYWMPRFLEKCLDFLSLHLDAVAVSTGLTVRRLHGNEETLPKMLLNPEAPVEPWVITDFFRFWADHDHVRTGSNIIRRNIILMAGYQREDLRICEDLEYWGYIATYGKWGFIPEPLWVGNSRRNAAASGWMEKYRRRRQECPDVESWEARIAPRLKPEQQKDFKVVRGRIAADYALSKILGGARGGAREIVLKYGRSMPDNRTTRLMRNATRFGEPIWWMLCEIIRLREQVKACKMWWWAQERRLT